MARTPTFTGWCNPSNPPESHRRCQGGNEANPQREWVPCPCVCHPAAQ